MQIFKKISQTKKPSAPRSLAIEGIPPAPMTAEPDDAELATQALLDSLAEMVREKRSSRKRRHAQQDSHRGDKPRGKDGKASQGEANMSADAGSEPVRDAHYYKVLAERIREAHRTAALRAMRFVYNCEQELQRPDLPYYGPKSLQLLEAELYKRIDIIEREGGELKRRWQHCLAEVTVRLMDAPPPKEKPHTDSTGENNVPQKEQK